ncbi:similar to Saccharomyces cerevisiae YKL018W SWD2 Subunit of the COMPASS (Set1C) complex, which methylates histone H3 on lys 4 and is involved in telomeric silencing [Maudiozyma saulgeensis]|uniref:Similar to Saccharomyces cerevisiae YKL018W SWD2 Subunit of the COMPASS (Set1C) complex, which methylates histone H3 on lys 4 and is involved in telomeric silencing n=1 Tax=Maudiozyma saulgeensis TaxID=1789683 RepID=A0A1X7QXE1_9SACH|nr:similar to Saccharomyces cerevisiae YKL018W SWD2 Subunit of the COMPASS (Set1C) complex, which methylates histone H3 on lys 4 and is involved in telomeric silencing [Kazachstania saulgeensis]
MSLDISRDTLSKYKVVKSFSVQEKEVSPVTSLSFDDHGKYLLTAAANDNMHLYDAVSCKFLNTIGSKKYGCHSARFTHAQNECIYSSTMKSFDIRHLNLETNQYIRYFTGHGALVHDIQMSPLDDTFISASYDESVRLWDLRSSKAQAIIPSLVPNCIAYDPSGLVVALGNPESMELALYNLKQLGKGPFLTVKIDNEFNNWNKMEFSNDGKYLLLATSYGKHLVLDAFSGVQLFELTGTKPFPLREFMDAGSATFTPDGQFILGTDYDGKVAIWNHSDSISNRTLKPTAYIPAAPDSCPRSIAMNPKYSMFVTADENVDFYVFDEDK